MNVIFHPATDSSAIKNAQIYQIKLSTAENSLKPVRDFQIEQISLSLLPKMIQSTESEVRVTVDWTLWNIWYESFALNFNQKMDYSVQIFWRNFETFNQQLVVPPTKLIERRVGQKCSFYWFVLTLELIKIGLFFSHFFHSE